MIINWELYLPNRITLMYYWAKLIGLAPFNLKNDRLHPPTVQDKIYLATFLGIHAFLSSMAVYKKFKMEAETTSKPTIGQNVDMSYYVLGSMTTSLIIIILFVMRKKIVELVNKLCSMSNDFNSIGIEEDDGKFLGNNFVIIVMINVFHQITSVIAYFFNPTSKLLFIILHYINVSITLNMIVMFAEILLCIRYRFALVNKKLYNFHSTTNDNSSLSRRTSATFVTGSKPPEENQAECDDFADIQRLRKIELLHLELCELVDRTTYIFSAPILLSVLRMLFRLLLFSYLGYRKLSIAIQLTAEEYFSSKWSGDFVQIWQMVFIIVELFIVAHACVGTCRQGNATRIMLSKLRNKIESSEIQGELYMFYIQLLHTPVVISVYKLFDLNYGLLYKIFCAVVAYLIIIIQAERPRPIGGT